MGALIEPLAVALHGVAQIPLQRVRTCVVIGCGPIGLLTGLGLRSRGVPEIYLSDPVKSRRLLAEAIGFTAVSPGDLAIWFTGLRAAKEPMQFSNALVFRTRQYR